MSKKENDYILNLIQSAIKPVEQQLSAVFSKLDEISNEIREIKSVILPKNLDHPQTVANKTDINSAMSTPVQSCSASTPDSCPAQTRAITRPVRQTAVRAKENLAPKTKQSLPKRRPEQQQPKPSRLSSVHLNSKQTVTKKTVTKDSVISPLLKQNCDSQVAEDSQEDTFDEAQEKNIAENEWKVVEKPRRRAFRPSTVIKGTAENTVIKGVEVHKYLHACFFKIGTTATSILNYLKTIKNGYEYSVEQIISKRDTYTSFKIGIPNAVFDEFLSTSVWPVNVSVSEWQPFLRPRSRDNKHQPAGDSRDNQDKMH